MLVKPHGHCSMDELNHLNARGEAHMVNIGAKSETLRQACAESCVQLSPQIFSAVRSGTVPKGDVLAVVRIAALQATKKTADLIPLCHPLLLTSVSVELEFDEAKHQVFIRVTAQLTGRTGVEMEAMTGASIGALTLYDMVKGLDKGIHILYTRLLFKSGGKSGDWHAERC